MRLTAIVMIAVLIGLSGCGSGHHAAKTKPSATVAGDAQGPDTVQVAMKGGRFVPADVKAKVGQVVVWTNKDHASRAIKASNGPRFASRRLRPHATFTYRLSAPGTINYASPGQSTMRGKITVTH